MIEACILCLQLPTQEDAPPGKFAPKYDMDSRGHKTLDLGFGASRHRPSSDGMHWHQLRKVASFQKDGRTKYNPAKMNRIFAAISALQMLESICSAA